MRPQHTSPQPVRVRFYDPEQRTEVLRGVGSRITCPVCGKPEYRRAWSELRAWLRQHLAEEHGT